MTKFGFLIGFVAIGVLLVMVWATSLAEADRRCEKLGGELHPVGDRYLCLRRGTVLEDARP